MFAALNVSTFLLAFIPACINLGILFYLLRFMPKGKLTNIFSILLLTVLALQLEHSIVRLNVSVEIASYVNKIFSLGWLAMGPVALHFAVIFSGYKISNSRIFYTLLYGPLIVFFSIYHANPIPIPHLENETWGYLIYFRPNTTDLIQRYWIGGLIYISLFILFRFAFSKNKEIQKRKQAMLIAVGMLIPSIQGIITQVVFPMIGLDQIPVTSTFITFLSIAIIIALTRYRLFNISESINLDKVLSELDSMVFFISTDQKLLYMNPSSKDEFLNKENDSQLMLSQIFLTKLDYENFCHQNCRNHILKAQKPVRNYETTFVNYKNKPIHVLVNSQPIYNNRKFQGVMIFANDITDRIIAEKEIKLSKERYDFVVKATNEVIWDLDIMRNKIYWGQRYNEVFGYNLNEGFTDVLHWEQRIHPEDYADVLKSFNNYLNNNISTKWEIKYRYLRSDNTYVEILDRGFILRDSEGNAIRMIGAMQDITATNTYIKKIEDQNKRLNEIAWHHSHILRAPLARVMAVANLLLDENLNKEETSTFLEAILQSCGELDGVVREINKRAENIKN